MRHHWMIYTTLSIAEGFLAGANFYLALEAKRRALPLLTTGAWMAASLTHAYLSAQEQQAEKMIILDGGEDYE